MNRFLTELKTRYPTLEFASVETLLVRAERARIPLSVAEELSPVVLVPYKVRDVLQVALRRNLELAKAFVSVFNAELYIPLFVLARAVVETGALALDVWDRVNDIGRAGDRTGLPALDEHLAKALLGAKTSITPDSKMYEAPNVLTLMDRLSRKHALGLRSQYDALSEFAHPNFLGMIATYRPIDPDDRSARRSRYDDRPFSTKAELLLVPLNALGAGLTINLTAIDTFEKNLGLFTRICEEDMHVRGLWPAGSPYPPSRKA